MEKNLHFLIVPTHLLRNNLVKILVVFLVLFIQSTVIYSQDINTKFRLSAKNTPLKTILETMREQSKLDFIYSDDEIKNYNVNVNLNGVSLKDALDEVLKNTPLTFIVKENKIVSIYPKNEKKVQQKEISVKGKVTNSQKSPIIGATVLILGTTNGTITDEKGNFSVKLNAGGIIEASFVGMKTFTKKIMESNDNMIIQMEEDAMSVEDVVVTGIYTRKAESFTGSYSSFNTKELQSVGGNNLIQSLRTLDPSFNVLENNQFGSDPNRLPDIEIRGKSSMLGTREEYETDPNQPLFILDGMETTLQTIFNLDMNRIASVTLLKDAASTAIYGSKAANGVVVVETYKPTAGQLRLSYNGTFSVSMPDLTSYNLMNSWEKLEFERLAGGYIGQQSAENELLRMEMYNKKLSDIASGVDTYWLGDPLRTGFNQRHSITVDGGEGDFAFAIGGSYNGINGVMKQSDRDVLSGNIDLSYRANKLIFSNKFSIDHTTSENPIVSFSEYASVNPYYKKYNAEGRAEKWLEYNDLLKASNPLYNALQNSRDKSIETSLRNIFQVQYNVNEDFRASIKFGLTKIIAKGENFISPDNTRYDEKSVLEKGDYTSLLTNGLKYEGEASVSYGKLLNEKHLINIVLGGNINNYDNVTESYRAQGFPSGDFTFPSFANKYPEYGKPSYNQTTSRSVSAFINTGYSYDNRYLIDASYRVNGASIFGTSKRYAHTWAVGLAWNIHNEKFIKEHTSVISTLKLRASIGNPGNQNFNTNMIYTTFGYNYSSFNYFGMSSQLDMVGNPNLKWQTTMDKNIGVDLKLFNGRLSIIADYFHKLTDPLLISVDSPSSLGIKNYKTNMGEQTTWGVNGTIKYNLIQRPADRIMWTIGGNFRTDKSRINGIGNKLEALNKNGQKNRYFERYYDGSNPNDLWAVVSRGIDPSTGREIFLDKNGKETFDFSYDYETIVGNSRPKLEGTFNTVISYKGLSLDIYFRYRLGADEFNTAVFSKVENISNGALQSNQDKRALYDRWQKPGDIATYKDITSSASTPISSRFIQRNNTLTLETVRVNYEFPNELIKKWGMSSLRVSAYTNEIARISTIKAERGIQYPFARTVNFSLTLNF